MSSPVTKPAREEHEFDALVQKVGSPLPVRISVAAAMWAGVVIALGETASNATIKSIGEWTLIGSALFAIGAYYWLTRGLLPWNPLKMWSPTWTRFNWWVWVLPQPDARPIERTILFVAVAGLVITIATVLFDSIT
jgi:hypothetical protein